MKTKDIPVGYDDLRIQCCEYEANRRPLIDVVRCDLQNLFKNAAEVDLQVLKEEDQTPKGLRFWHARNQERGNQTASAVQVEMSNLGSTKEEKEEELPLDI